MTFSTLAGDSIYFSSGFSTASVGLIREGVEQQCFGGAHGLRKRIDHSTQPLQASNLRERVRTSTVVQSPSVRAQRQSNCVRSRRAPGSSRCGYHGAKRATTAITTPTASCSTPLPQRSTTLVPSACALCAHPLQAAVYPESAAAVVPLGRTSAVLRPDSDAEWAPSFDRVSVVCARYSGTLTASTDPCTGGVGPVRS